MFAHRIRQLLEGHTNLETTKLHHEYARRSWNPQLSQEQENLQLIVDVVDHAPLVRGDLGLLGSRKKFGKLLEHAALRHRSNNFRFNLTLVE